MEMQNKVFLFILENNYKGFLTKKKKNKKQKQKPKKPKNPSKNSSFLEKEEETQSRNFYSR